MCRARSDGRLPRPTSPSGAKARRAPRTPRPPAGETRPSVRVARRARPQRCVWIRMLAGSASSYRRAMQRDLLVQPAPLDPVEPVATYEIRGGGGVRLSAREWGERAGPAILFIHGWSQCDACWTKQVAGPLADVVPDGHRRSSGSWALRQAHGQRSVCGRTAVGARRGRGDRPDRSGAAGRRRLVLRRLHRHGLLARVRRRRPSPESTSSAAQS